MKSDFMLKTYASYASSTHFQNNNKNLIYQRVYFAIALSFSAIVIYIFIASLSHRDGFTL